MRRHVLMLGAGVISGLAGLSAAIAQDAPTGNVAWQLELIMPRSGARGVMVEEGCEMLGDLVLILALCVYARYVLLDVEGLLPRAAKRKKTKRGKAAETSGSEDATTSKKRDDLGSVATASAGSASSQRSGKASEKTASKPASEPASRRIDAAENPLDSRKLSRAERRAQRRAGRGED